MEYLKLTDVCRPKQWKTISGKDLLTEGYPVYGANGIIGYWSDFNHSSETVTIACRGTCGTVNIVPAKSYINGNAMSLDNLSETINLRFLYYYLRGYDFKEIITGTTIPQITIEGLRKVLIPRLSLENQEELAHLFDKVQNVIDARQKEIQMLDELIKARFVEMFGDYKESVKLSEVATVTGGLTKNSKRESLPLKLPYLRVANVSYDNIDTSEMLEIGLTQEERDKTLLKYGDLLFVEGNGSPDQIGRVAVWRDEITPCVHQNHLIKARFNSAEMLPIFAMHYYMTDRGRRQIQSKAVSTSGLYTLSVQKVADFLLPEPPISQQKQFAAFVAQIDKSKAAVQKALDESQVLFDSLMQQYFG